jgi:predicted transposase YbfD/YdcC
MQSVKGGFSPFFGNADKEAAKMNAIVRCVASVPDPRRGNHRKHALGDMLFASLVSVMCGYDSYTAFARFTELNLEWLRGMGCPFANGVPSHDAFRYAFSVVDHGIFSACLRNVAGIAAANAGGGVVAIDGKAVRRGRKRGGKTPYIVNAWAEACGVVLGEVKVDEKSNEIPAIPEVLRTLGLEGCIVTVDAAGCQKTVMRQIVRDCKADAVLALKDNQKTLHDEMLLLFEREREASPRLFAKYEAPAEKNSGRVERRTCWQTDYVGWFEDIDEWYGLRSVIMVEAERSVRNAETGEWETSSERRLYISSLGVDPELALETTRKHWGVESMHWTLDVTYREDYCRARTGHAAANRASVRRMAASLTIPWARRRKFTVKEAMMFANQSKEARLEMLL